MILNQLGCYGNTHWFTWETPGSNVSIVSLETQRERETDNMSKMKEYGQTQRCLESCLVSSHPLSVLSLRSWGSHRSCVALRRRDSGRVRDQLFSLRHVQISKLIKFVVDSLCVLCHQANQEGHRTHDHPERDRHRHGGHC